MNETELQRFEEELRRVRPARPPENFMARLKSARPLLQSRRPAPARVASGFGLPPWLMQWLVPAAAVVAAMLVVWRLKQPSMSRSETRSAAAFKADNVQIDQELISAFDAVARLSSGEPVRFRCRTWMDQVVLSDKDGGVVIEQRTPRVEVVPVRFETY